MQPLLEKLIMILTQVFHKRHWRNKRSGLLFASWDGTQGKAEHFYRKETFISEFLNRRNVDSCGVLCKNTCRFLQCEVMSYILMCSSSQCVYSISPCQTLSWELETHLCVEFAIQAAANNWAGVIYKECHDDNASEKRKGRILGPGMASPK